MRNIVIGYIAALAIIITAWMLIIPPEEKVMQKLAQEKMATTVRALQSEILSRYGTVSISGNLSYMIYTYRNVSISHYEVMPNLSTIVIYFDVTRLNRVKRFGTVIKEYYLPPENKSIVARKVGEAWHVDTSTIKNLTTTG